MEARMYARMYTHTHTQWQLLKLHMYKHRGNDTGFKVPDVHFSVIVHGEAAVLLMHAEQKLLQSRSVYACMHACGYVLVSSPVPTSTEVNTMFKVRYEQLSLE